ncbi:hypothetical protein D3C86_1117380 [compost metagenome]
MANAVFAKLVLVTPATHLEVTPLLDASTHKLGHRRQQPQRLTQHVVALLKVGIATPDEVQGHLLEGLATQQFVRDEGSSQGIAFEVEPRLQIHTGSGRFGQAIQRQRRLVPTPVRPALQVVEDLPAIEHRYRIAKGECMGLTLRRQRLNQIVSHQQISMMPVLAAVCPSSGSLCRAWNNAHAKSA